MRTKEKAGDFEANQQNIFEGEEENDKLSIRQIQFCYEYVAHKGNRVLAAMAAGCTNKKTAGVRAHKWLKRDKIQKKIADITARHFKGLKVKAEDVLNELATLGFSDVQDVATWDETGKSTLKSSNSIGEKTRAIREIEITEDRLTTGDKDDIIIRKNIKFKMHPKKDALELLLKVQHPDMFKEYNGDKPIVPQVNLNLSVDGKDIQDKNSAELARSYFEILKVLSGSK